MNRAVLRSVLGKSFHSSIPHNTLFRQLTLPPTSQIAFIPDRKYQDNQLIKIITILFLRLPPPLQPRDNLELHLPR